MLNVPETLPADMEKQLVVYALEDNPLFVKDISTWFYDIKAVKGRRPLRHTNEVSVDYGKYITNITGNMDISFDIWTGPDIYFRSSHRLCYARYSDWSGSDTPRTIAPTWVVEYGLRTAVDSLLRRPWGVSRTVTDSISVDPQRRFIRMRDENKVSLTQEKITQLKPYLEYIVDEEGFYIYALTNGTLLYFNEAYKIKSDDLHRMASRTYLELAICTYKP